MNILSIDFDIIMAPVIEYYNNMVPMKNWDEICTENPGMLCPKADLFHYNLILKLLNKLVNQDTSLYIAFNHKMIVDFIDDNDDIFLINIDHHHDLGYAEEDDTKEGTLKNLNCGNWVKYLFDKSQLREYVWINNRNSLDVTRELIDNQVKNYNCKKINFENAEETILKFNYDKIFICLSPEWVPPYYHTLFYGLVDFINEKTNKHFIIHEDNENEDLICKFM